LSSYEIPEIFEPSGACLYHYTHLRTALEFIFPEWQLRMTPFSLMRDPRESRNWGFEGSISDIFDAREQTMRFARLAEMVKELKDRTKVLALTQDDPTERDAESAVFGRGFAHPRLWEHYADDHRGVCLAFDRKTLTDILVGSFSAGALHHGRVNYVDREIAVDARRFLMENIHGLPDADVINEHLGMYRDELFFTKLRDWETEAEYRFVLHTDHVEHVHASIRNSVRAVILGDAVSPSYVPALAAQCDPVTVPIWRMRWQEARPRFQDPRAPGVS
jgi:hypothetical protein